MTQDVLSFVVRLCSYVLVCALFSVLNAFIVKHDKKSQAFAELREKLPLFIRDCESRNIQGSKNKLCYVLDLAIAYIAPRLKMSVQDVRDRYASLIASDVEDILSTPHKKEVKDNGKTNETQEG